MASRMAPTSGSWAACRMSRRASTVEVPSDMLDTAFCKVPVSMTTATRWPLSALTVAGPDAARRAGCSADRRRWAGQSVRRARSSRASPAIGSMAQTPT
jgi:hypothetical protein